VSETALRELLRDVDKVTIEVTHLENGNEVRCAIAVNPHVLVYGSMEVIMAEGLRGCLAKLAAKIL